ncbi:MAG: hypothetical protein ABFS16_00965 [Bacteroidota bacterium]
MNRKHIVSALLILLLAGDLIFSFFQYYNTPLYGDVDSHVLPDKHIQKVFEDPFGFNAIKTGEKHANPNRFFAHYFYAEYMQKIPIYLQKITGSISSVYLSCALAKIIVQVIFIFLLASFISGESNIFKRKFLLSAILIAPLFQAYGYWSRMGINDKSIAYTFFYSVPLVFLMIFLKPFLNQLFRNISFRSINYLLLLPLVIILPLSGPLIPAIIGIILLLMVIYYWIQSKNHITNRINSFFNRIPLQFYLLLLPIGIISIYSLFLGFYNSQNQAEIVSLAGRYALLPKGIYSHVFHAFGFPLMLSMIGINSYLIKKVNTQEGKKLLRVLIWIGIYSLIYILLLPFGGYKIYRSLIIRYDTIMPVTTALIYFFGASSYFLLNNLKGKNKTKYSVAITICLLIYTVADIKGIGSNKCEREALEKMANSTESIVPVPKDCYIMNWENIYDYKRSDRRAELIHHWKITPEKKLFFNEK